MGTFVPTTAAEREQMLRTIGVSSVEDLFRDVPQQMYLDGYLDLPPGRSELETLEAVSALAERNRVFKTCLRGAGSYRHYIPAAVNAGIDSIFVDWKDTGCQQATYTAKNLAEVEQILLKS